MNNLPYIDENGMWIPPDKRLPAAAEGDTSIAPTASFAEQIESSSLPLGIKKRQPSRGEKVAKTMKKQAGRLLDKVILFDDSVKTTALIGAVATLAVIVGSAAWELKDELGPIDSTTNQQIPGAPDLPTPSQKLPGPATVPSLDFNPENRPPEFPFGK